MVILPILSNAQPFHKLQKMIIFSAHNVSQTQHRDMINSVTPSKCGVSADRPIY